MDLLEHEAKALLRDAGLPVPAGRVVAHDAPVPADREVVVKAQVPFGGRGKRGLVLPAAPPSVAETVGLIRGRMVDLGFAAPTVLLEAKVEAVAEHYLAWSIDDAAQAYALAFSRHGGVDVEAAPEPPARLHVGVRGMPTAHELVPFFARQGFSGRTLTALCRFAVASWRVFVQADATLLEINPLAVLARGDVVALDAKVSLDDNARSRHLEWGRSESSRLASAATTDLERRAAAAGFTFVELGGDVAVLSGGAGLGMALLDVLADAGMPAANFVDASGGSASGVFGQLARLVMERAARDDVKAVLMYFTLSATSLGSVARSLIALIDEAPPPKPMMVGLLVSGAAEREMSFDQARALFEARGYRCERDIAGIVDALRALHAA